MSCGTYDRHNHVAQVALSFVRYELKFTGSTSSVGSNFVGTSADGKSKHTESQTDRSGGGLSWLRRMAFGVSIVNPTLHFVCPCNRSQPLGCRRIRMRSGHLQCR